MIKEATGNVLTQPFALADWRLPVYGAKAVRFCAENDINALQIDFGGPGRAPCLNNIKRQDAILDACTKYNIQITALAANQFNEIGLGSLFDKKQLNGVRQLIITILDIAVRFSAPLVFFPSFYQGLIRNQETRIRTAHLLTWICQEAKARQLIIGNENDLSIEWAKQLASEVAAPNFYFIFDSYNPLKAGHCVIEQLEYMNGYFVSQVHIKDGWKGQNGYIALGSGDGNVARTLFTLMQLPWVERYVLENDYRHCSVQKIHDDLRWMRQRLAVQTVN